MGARAYKNVLYSTLFFIVFLYVRLSVTFYEYNGILMIIIAVVDKFHIFLL